MSEIVSIGSETLLEFVKREGVTNTSNVGSRFAWTMDEARKRLRALCRQGLIRERGKFVHPTASCGGAVIEWEPVP